MEPGFPGFRCDEARRRAMRALVSAFLKDESGATAIEYALIAAGIAIAIIGAVNGVGEGLKGKLKDIKDGVMGVVPPA